MLHVVAVYPDADGERELEGHDGREDKDVASEEHGRTNPTDPAAQRATCQPAGAVPRQRNGGDEKRQRDLVPQAGGREGRQRGGLPEP